MPFTLAVVDNPVIEPEGEDTVNVVGEVAVIVNVSAAIWA